MAGVAATLVACEDHTANELTASRIDTIPKPAQRLRLPRLRSDRTGWAWGALTPVRLTSMVHSPSNVESTTQGQPHRRFP